MLGHDLSDSYIAMEPRMVNMIHFLTKIAHAIFLIRYLANVALLVDHEYVMRLSRFEAVEKLWATTCRIAINGTAYAQYDPLLTKICTCNFENRYLANAALLLDHEYVMRLSRLEAVDKLWATTCWIAIL